MLYQIIIIIKCLQITLEELQGTSAIVKEQVSGSPSQRNSINHGSHYLRVLYFESQKTNAFNLKRPNVVEAEVIYCLITIFFKKKSLLKLFVQIIHSIRMNLS